MQLLLENKADPLERSARHQTALGLAQTWHHKEVIALLKPLSPVKGPRFAEREASEHEMEMQRREENKKKRAAKKAEVQALIKAKQDAGAWAG